jgi:hypothetical protein
MTRLRIALCGVVLVGAFAAVYVGVWEPLRVACAALGLGVAGWLAARLLPAGTVLERILDGVFSVAALSLVLGLVLNYASGGLTRHGFAIGWCAIGIVLLALVSGRGALPPRIGALPRDMPFTLIAACALFAAGTAGAFVVANAGVKKQGERPYLSLSALSYGGATATVEISSVDEPGPYGLTIRPDGSESQAKPATSVRLGSSGSKLIALQLPAARCFWSIQVATEGVRPVVRTVRLWVGTSSAGLLRRGGSPGPLVGRGGSRLPASCKHP